MSQGQEAKLFKKAERMAIPHDIDYWALGSLSTEERSKLAAHRPETLGRVGLPS